ncbi:MAG: biotin--[acetyl-CoA-carboxylase] ligase [Planctomycetales bacterium]|nr:biotin--[acetyl-CoA-carboxylase] ligase [Planctomycetales bacterium]
MEPLNAEEIARGLGTRRIGREIRCLESVPSTNDVGAEWAADGAPDGAVVLAEEQTRGRGRQGRSWASPRGGGLWLSVVLRPTILREDSAYLTVLGALAVPEAIRLETGLEARIRWPNDVLLGERKVAGVLAEIRDFPGAVLGIGLDVDLPPGALPPDVAETATSVAREAGRPVPRLPLLRSLLRALDEGYGRLLAGEREPIEAAWRARSAVLGRVVRVREPEGAVEGRVVDLEARGGLTLEVPGGGTRAVRGERVIRLEVLPG